jgi:hypothetical protein
LILCFRITGLMVNFCIVGKTVGKTKGQTNELIKDKNR